MVFPLVNDNLARFYHRPAARAEKILAAGMARLGQEFSHSRVGAILRAFRSVGLTRHAEKKGDKKMRTGLIVICMCFALSGFASEPNQGKNGEKASSQLASSQGSQPAPSQEKGCLAVEDAGSHAFRNIMLAGVAGALISKKQYKVVDFANYPARIGQKFHGSDLQTLQAGGTKIVILAKKTPKEQAQAACH
jgi:hypothetical protein